MRIRSLAVMGILCWVAGCGDDDDANTLGAKLDRALTEDDTNEVIRCTCSDDDEDSCERDEPLSEASRACYLRVLQSDALTAATFLDCNYAALKAENDCLAQPGRCAAEPETDACDDIGEVARARCFLPDALEDRVDDECDDD